jgi:hypothetical protein
MVMMNQLEACQIKWFSLVSVYLRWCEVPYDSPKANISCIKRCLLERLCFPFFLVGLKNSRCACPGGFRVCKRAVARVVQVLGVFIVEVLLAMAAVAGA